MMTVRDDFIKLRAHHLLCMLGFVGMGYDAAFIDNFNNIISRLNKNKAQMVKVVIGADDVCVKCPNLNDNECNLNSPTSPLKRDMLTMESLNIKPNSTSSFDDLLKNISTNIDMPKLDIICKDCKWLDYGHCIHGLENLYHELKC